MANVNLKDITDVRDGTHDTPKKLKSGVKLVTSRQLKQNQILPTDYFISEEDAVKVDQRSKVDKWDILITMIGTVGDLHLVREEPDYVIKNIGLVKTGGNELLAKYLFYYLKSSEGQAEIKARMSGTSQQFISLSNLRALSVKLFSEKEMQYIANKLDVYDLLIQNNSRRIEKLESMARLLYDHYFKVPEATDWEQKSIAEILSGHIGGGWGSDNHGDSFSDPAYVIRGTDIPPARTGDISGVPFRFHKSSNLSSRKLIPGDIIFEVSGGSKGQPLGRSLLITEKLLAVFNEDVMCASFCKRVTPNQDIIAPEILYLSFLEAYENGEIDTYSVQSTGISNFKWSEYIERVTRSIPPLELQQDFQDKVVPIFRQINVLGIRNTNLRKTRDLLLPKLMSGEIRV